MFSLFVRPKQLREWQEWEGMKLEEGRKEWKECEERGDPWGRPRITEHQTKRLLDVIIANQGTFTAYSPYLDALLIFVSTVLFILY
jgi:hypothetical protein